ncbi:MAG: hypothetical protein U1F40_02600 [Turneriella sp.]
MDTLSFQPRSRLSDQPPNARVNSAMDGYRRPFDYIDFIVNGKSLADIFDVDQRDLVGMLTRERLLEPQPTDRDIFNHFHVTGRLFHELTLDLPCRLEYRRVHIYGCPECGDLYCGSVTMQILETPHSVIWQRFDNGREEIAPYMSPDKSYSNDVLYQLWLERGRDYTVLDAFGLSNLENDYEFMVELKYGNPALDPGGDLRRGAGVEIEYPHVGPFEFEKTAYMTALNSLRQQVAEGSR